MREELEAKLQKDWSVETLKVYADVLIEQNDPRGTIISCHLASRRLSPRARSEHWHKAREAMRQWLGEEAERSSNYVDTGFLELPVATPHKPVSELLRGPAMPWLRLFQRDIHEASLLGQFVATLAAMPRPWLTRLSLKGTNHSNPPTVVKTRALFSNAPNLKRLDLQGYWEAEGLERSKAETLSADSGAMNALQHTKVKLPRVKKLICHHFASSEPVAAEQLPNVTEVDLRGDELPGGGSVHFSWLVRTPLLPQLKRLRLGWFETADDWQVWETARKKLPADCVVELARYAKFKVEAGVRARPWHPWNHRSQYEATNTKVTLGGVSVGFTNYDVHSALERHFDLLSDRCVMLWGDYWALLYALKEPSIFPVGELVEAATELATHDDAAASWLAQLQEAIAQHPNERAVKIRG